MLYIFGFCESASNDEENESAVLRTPLNRVLLTMPFQLERQFSRFVESKNLNWYMPYELTVSAWVRKKH